MRKTALLLSFVVYTMFVSAQLLLREDFDYDTNSRLSNQGNWSQFIEATPYVFVTESSITYPDYPGSGVGNEITLNNSSGERVFHNFTEQTAGTIYTSFLINVSSISTTNGYWFLHLGPTNLENGESIARVLVKGVGSGKFVFGILMAQGSNATYTTATYDLNSTNLIVFKHDISNKISSIIVNPPMNTEPDDNWFSSSNEAFMTSQVGCVGFRQTTENSQLSAKVDGIRIATSWQDLFSVSRINNVTETRLEVLVSDKNLLLKNVAEGSEVEIFSVTGSKIQTSAVKNAKVNIANLKTGVYIVRSGKLTKKIIL
jgi:hypothetical protein